MTPSPPSTNIFGDPVVPAGPAMLNQFGDPVVTNRVPTLPPVVPPTGKQVADTALKSLPFLGAAAATMFGQPEAWLPAIAMAGGGGAVGSAIEQGTRAATGINPPTGRVTGSRIGDALANVGEDAAGMGLGEGLGRGLTGAGLWAWSKFLPSDLTNATERAALDYAKGKGIPVSVGQDTGQIGLQRGEQALQNFPGSATRAQQFYRTQQAALSNTGADLAASPSMGMGTATPSGLDAHGEFHPALAGQNVIDALSHRVDSLKSYADKLYDSTRQTTARNLQDVPTGESRYIPNPQAGIDPTASPVTPVPLMAKMATPVDLAPIRAQLLPVYDELNRTISPSQRQYSPAWGALQSFMTSDIKQMPALDFDKFLGAVKAISRNGDSPLLSTQSQRMAKQVISAGEQAFQNSIADAGPNVLDKLTRARKAVAEYHDTADLLGSLHDDEPAALYNQLVTAGQDKARNMLTQLNQVAPNAVKAVGRSYLEAMMNKATAEGGFGRSAGIMADWRRMGPDTKQLLFGPDLTNQMDNFLLASKRLTENTNPSGTAHTLAALGGWGAAGEMVRALITGNPLEAAAVGTGAFVAPNIAARVLFNPDALRAATQAISSPTTSAAFGTAMRGLTALIQGAAQPKQEYQPPGSENIMAPTKPVNPYRR